MWYNLKRRLTTGLGGRCLGAKRCPVAPPSGWSWLADLGDGVNWVFFLVFLILLKIHGDYWQGAGMVKSVPSATVTGLELRGQGPHM